MIKITVNSAVYEALSKAFPKPAASAKKAITKYITVLEQMLFKSLHYEATPLQRKLDLFSLSLEKLAQQGGQIGPNKIRVHKWLQDNRFNLVEAVIIGSNLNGQLSQCKLTKWVTVIDTLEVEEEILKSAKTDKALDAYLLGDEFSNYQLVNALYPELSAEFESKPIQDYFDLLEVDIESLKSYIFWIATEAKLLSLEKKQQALRQAKIILGVASVMNGNYLQRRKPSEFGRMYYEGVSVQNINKELRRAVLGDCWEYDIRSSVVAWKMGWAQSYIDSRGMGENLRRVFSATLGFLEDKADFMATVRYFTFEEDSPVPKDLQPKLLKQAFTAISFGARVSSVGWQNEAGGWSNPAIVDIIQNSKDRERFLADSTVNAFIHEQSELDAHIYDVVKIHRKDLLAKSFLKTPSGRSSKSKILAYLYQHYETEIMDVVRSVAKDHGREPIASVHDAIFFKKKLGIDLKHECELSMREHSNNPYWYLSPKQLERYQPRHLDLELAEAEHKARIQEEERRAREHFANLSVD
ncbi:MAG: hypothetical protein B7Y59_07475 [Burkholderiales bacterium 35-55-47]|jgi:hypothetical protein|uniref:hypothetical protein n=1 Tax=Limnohabitans sp. TaxID=1907725 RepID=UPI000BCA7B33|nr:hypothetical protein [Limnohabitans sp.]OYY18923.1 MAG: hypothetical protein B7Y59_07475 [Burkholderiales bacterium 35-55-47]OYZ73741.1 MAG: hypothetical protein B7Y06_06905 [Burkholderiales bacterium 24-55-52]OZB00886.1 MAG: hypothetical protein B7X62_06920 [Burkholderiales bacterium 39-55-53]HQR85326.1 hypothetical protein [Limnohabitans sp.]HQS27266.1 hypothetical protein [Limnohabitans sp.]